MKYIDKSLWNTLDIEPGAGSMAYLKRKDNNKKIIHNE